MKRTILLITLSALLSSCGGGGQGGDELPASPVVERHRSI